MRTEVLKVARLKISLPDGMTVLFAKKESLDLAAAVKAANDTHKLLLHAQNDGLSAATVAKASAERARKPKATTVAKSGN